MGLVGRMLINFNGAKQRKVAKKNVTMGALLKLPCP